uniref:Serine/threonine-protein kinase Tel1 n=1 Tax=Mycena chlorophos TaxID=658473 RepID=A0ABQ0L8N2_MYCCL|nr:predicted protein [Mycena chlorophos]
MSVRTPQVLDNALGAVGQTPLIRIDKIRDALGLKCNLLAKLEYLSVGGSVKDRIAKAMIEAAEHEGKLNAQSVIIEPTSGNTGIGMAMASAIKGYRCIITLPDKMSLEKEAALRALGAEVVRTPTAAAWDSPESHIGVAKKLEKAIPGGIILDQYRNVNNPLAHELTTGPEIIEAVVSTPSTPERPSTRKVDVVICGAGTGGTVTGVSRAVKKHNPDCVVVGVDPKGSILALPESLNQEDMGKPYVVEGIGYDFVPDVLHRNEVDAWVKTGDDESFAGVGRLMRSEGLLTGGSSGTALAGAEKWFKTATGSKVAQTPGMNVVLVLPDGLRNYISKPWFLKLAMEGEASELATSIAEVLKANERVFDLNHIWLRPSWHRPDARRVDMANFNEGCRLLESQGRITDRTNGLAELASYFGSGDAFTNLQVPHWTRFLKVYQSFANTELNIFNKGDKSSAAAQKRLTTGAQLLRQVIEGGVKYFPYSKVAKLFLDHLVTFPIVKQRLLEPVALEYIKSLRILIEWNPNLDRMDKVTWVAITEFAFNAVLDDKLRTQFIEDASNSDQEGEDSDGMTGTSPRKRRKGPHPSQRDAKRQRPLRKPTQEQSELVPCLCVLLRSPSAPFLAEDQKHLPAAILHRLQRFLQTYSPDASFFRDYLLLVLHTLSHLSLNHTKLVTRFACANWEALVGLWESRNKSLKECLVAVLYTLFPYVKASGSQHAPKVSLLSKALEGEADSRWGTGGLSLDCLRLEVAPKDERRRAFTAKTFRAGNNLQEPQALAWAILELQADCLELLHQDSESVVPSSQLKGELGSLLASLDSAVESRSLTYRLQTLLFVIDRHWAKLHDGLQAKIFTALKSYIASTSTDPEVQSWALVCVAAIAHADTSVEHVPPARDWDLIWTHTLRRTNVPSIARAACHAAQVMMSCSQSRSTTRRIALTPQNVLVEIEALAKDLDVQGPPFPYDSVCAFLSQVLRMANQDVRLHRAQLEEKALSWLVDCWTPQRTSTTTSYAVRDIVSLLETICGASRHSDLFSGTLLPDCLIVDTLVEAEKTRIIRDFLLEATLPSPPLAHSSTPLPIEPATAVSSDDKRSTEEPAEESPLERRVSTFLFKSLDALLVDLPTLPQPSALPSVDKARAALDWAVIGLAFQAVLSLNGTRPNRRVIQAATKVFSAVVPLIRDTRWKEPEQLSVLLALQPLTATGACEDESSFTIAFATPDIGSGVKTDALSVRPTHVGESVARRIELQKLICKSADVQDCFMMAVEHLREIVQQLVGQQQTNQPRDDDFDQAPMRDARASGSSSLAIVRHIADICISFLSVIPLRLSASGNPTREPQLTDLVFNCTKEDTVLAAPEVVNERSFIVYEVFLSHVRSNHLAFSDIDYDRFIEELSQIIGIQHYARSNIAHMLVITFIGSTLERWIKFPSPQAVNTRKLCAALSWWLMGGTLRSWTVRDALARLYDRYLELDPHAANWYVAGEDPKAHAKGLPSDMLPTLNADEDARVRFRAAGLATKLLTVRRTGGLDIMKDVYGSLLETYPKDLSEKENILTRILGLGSAMIISSAVRRGAYWHLLEAGIVHDTENSYARHSRAILVAVAEILRLPTFASLFEAYASQLADTMKTHDVNFARLDPTAFGYRDRREAIEKNFKAFTPTNLVTSGQGSRGDELFAGLCAALRKDPRDGIRECFADVVGFELLQSLTANPDMTSQEFAQSLQMNLGKHQSDEDSDEMLGRHVDGIQLWMLRTVEEQDFGPNGPLAEALRVLDQSGAAVGVFQALVRYRRVDDFPTHVPNAPLFGASDVLHALFWFEALVSDEADKTATAYHVAHELFAEIHHCVLINEQLRLLNALSIWIAMQSETFLKPGLLHVLLRGAASLMAQPELARAAQSILEWVFGCFITSRLDDPRLADILIRVCCLADDYGEQPSTAQLGSDLCVWIDRQVSLLAQAQPEDGSAVRALSAWPHTPSEELAGLVSSITWSSLSNVLSDSAIVSNKFRLVRQLRDLAASDDGDRPQFASLDFWRLRECIPSLDQLQIEDVDAFAGVLLKYEGEIKSISTEKASIRGRHRRDNAATGRAQEWVVHSLLVMLESSDSIQAHVAYKTLRLISSVTPESQWKGLPTQYHDEITYLHAYRRIPHTRPVRTLQELEENEVFLGSVAHFPRWVSAVAILLSDILSISEPFFAQLSLILEADSSFTENALPVLVRSVLENERAQLPGKDLSLLPVRMELSYFFTDVLNSPRVSTACIQSIVDIILHLRHFVPPSSSQRRVDALAYNKWLAMDYELLAGKALACGAYTTSLLFLELARDCPAPTPRVREVDSPMDGSDAPGINISEPEDVLYEIYAHIDEPDGFYGFEARDTNKFIMKRLHHEKQWSKAFQFHSAALEASTSNVQEAYGLLQSFHSFGFHHLAMDTLQKSLLSGAPIKSDMSYQLGWRTGTWDLPEQTSQTGPGVSLYNALRAVHRARSPRAIQDVIHRSIFSEMDRLRGLGSENLTEIREVAQNLMCLSQVSQWFQPDSQSRLASRSPNVDEWKEYIELGPGFEFSDFETIMATRMALVRSVRGKEQRQQIGNMVSPLSKALIEVEKRCLVSLSQAARDAQQSQIALNSMVRARTLEDTPSLEVSIEFANVLRLQKEEKQAVQFLKGLNIDSLDKPEKAVVQARLGTWMAEACMEKPAIISSKYFEPASKIVHALVKKKPELSVAVYRQYANFAEQQYKAFKNSKDGARLKMYVERKTAEIEQRRTQGENAMTSKPLQNANQQLQIDTGEYQRHIASLKSFLSQAVEMYSRALAASSEADGDGAVRLVSLWFENFEELDDNFRTVATRALGRTPTWKLVFLAHQLTARLAPIPNTTSAEAKPSPQQQNLHNLVMRMCIEHPFHTLYQVFSLLPNEQPSPPKAEPTHSRNLRRPSEPQPSTRQPSPARESELVRAAAALTIMQRLRTDDRCGSRVRDVERLAQACWEWCKFVINKTALAKTKVKNIPPGMLIRDIADLPIPVLTHSIPPDPTLKYDRCVHIVKYEHVFETAGGINLPKITKCVGTDGARYKELFKGEGDDDLRQDAVMEQVFTMCNTILAQDRETKRRELNVRGYKIVPLGSKAGVLEFVSNTTPLRNWLNTGHLKYNPGDYKPNDIQTKFSTHWEEHKSTQPERFKKLFSDCWDHFHPAQRHFFTESHKTPMAWYAMRLAYTRSVATTSIVGHILGLGDRHTSNILLDTTSGEVVHIDLGIAFDQGKRLGVPELVPFRMTRDMVDGMGSSGTGGVFQRCSEETLRVLREGSAVIMTVLEVFRHDPLHSWTASEIKLKTVQEGATRPVMGDIGIDMGSNSAQEEADRALAGVARKLDQTMSVEYTVNELIAEATDPERLGRMWHGWSPLY